MRFKSHKFVELRNFEINLRILFSEKNSIFQKCRILFSFLILKEIHSIFLYILSYIQPLPYIFVQQQKYLQFSIILWLIYHQIGATWRYRHSVFQCFRNRIINGNSLNKSCFLLLFLASAVTHMLQFHPV